jgi:ATP-binding cassette subfamily C protein
VIGVVLAALLRRRRPLAWLAVWSLLEALPAVLSGYAIARAVDHGFLAGRPATGLAWLGLLAVAVLIGAYGTRRAYRCLADLVEPFRDDLVEHVVTGTLRRCGEPEKNADPGAVSRLIHQVEIVRDTLAGWIMTVRGFGFALAGALLGMVSLAPVLLLFVLPPLLIGLASFAAAVPAMVSRQRAYVCADERLGDSTGEAAAALRDVVACGAEDQIGASVGAGVDAQARAERAIATMAAVRSLSLAVGGYLPLVLLLVGAPWLIRRGVSVGAVLGALTYVLHGLLPAVHTLVRGLGGGGLRLAVTLDRVLRAYPPPPPAAPGGGARPSGADLVLRGVTFRYGPHAEPVLADLDLVVERGAHLAILGASGIGKSTLAALLAGMLRPQGGEIRLGGVPLDRLDTATLARHRVLIPQEAYVFTGTLLDNLTYLRPDASLDEVAAAAAAIGLSPLVQRLGGYRASLDPRALSAGERQLVALTRAYLSPAALVLLDEATCHLDPVAELRAERAFAARPGSLVVVAHRISSALRARRILVLDGTGARLGSHDELLAGSDLYRALVGYWQPADPLQPTSLLRDPDGFQPVATTGLAHDGRHVVAHGADRQVQPASDVGARHA